jgi:hypothetical protein
MTERSVPLHNLILAYDVVVAQARVDELEGSPWFVLGPDGHEARRAALTAARRALLEAQAQETP